MNDLERNWRSQARGELLLTHWKGRFGNRMFTYLYGVNYSRRNGVAFYLPSRWEGSVLFKDSGARVIDDEALKRALTESAIGRMGLESRKREVEKYCARVGKSLSYHDPDRESEGELTNVYFEKLAVQGEHIFKRYSIGEVREIFSWSEKVLSSDVFKRHEEKKGSYCVAHLRRGDISNVRLNQKRDCGYSVLSRESYERAFEKFGVDRDEVIWITDDRSGNWGIEKSKSLRGTWKYPEGSELLDGVFFDWFEDFLTLYFAKSIFRANSSFSWWGACLNPDARVFSPILTRRKRYLAPGDELDVDFVEGNSPHWLNLAGGRSIDRIEIPV